MLTVGESINASLAQVKKAIESRDGAYIQALARQQVDCGAAMVDLNAGTGSGHEVEELVWLVETVQEAVATPLMLDSSSAPALAAALKTCRQPAVINSVSLEADRLAILPLVPEYGCGVVALCMGEDGIPKSAQGRLQVARELYGRLAAAGVEPSRIYFDPLVLGISTDAGAAAVAMDTVAAIKAEMPGVRTIAAVSNVSFGLPLRRLLNRTFLAMMVRVGLDACLIDVRDKALTSVVYAAEALAGHDRYCAQYAKSYRRGVLEG